MFSGVKWGLIRGVNLFGGSGGDRLQSRRSPPDKTSATANFRALNFPLRLFQLQSGSPAHFKASAFRNGFRASKGFFAHLEANSFREEFGGDRRRRSPPYKNFRHRKLPGFKFLTPFFFSFKAVYLLILRAIAFRGGFGASKGLFAHLETNFFGENSGGDRRRRSPPDKTSATVNFHTSIFPLRHQTVI